MTRHALVTGGAGFIGSHLVDRLLDEGWAVTTLDNFDPFYLPSEKRANIARHRDYRTFTLADADLRDEGAVAAALRDDYDVVVHLAARAGVRPSIAQPLLYQDVNVRGTQILLELCRRRGWRQVVFASSSSVYGINPNTPWREDDQVLMPISPYASTKVAGELLGHVYAHLYGIRFVGLRFFTAYGPRQRPDLAIHAFGRRMLAGQPITLYGTGGSRRDYTYVADVVAGVRAAMDYDASPYEIFNLGNCRAVGLRDLVREMEDALGVRARIEWAPEQPGDVPLTCADISKARRLLGYEPSTPLADGLAQFAVWLDGRVAAPARAYAGGAAAAPVAHGSAPW